MRAFAQDEAKTLDVRDCRQIFSSESVGELINLFYNDADPDPTSVPRPAFVDLAAIVMAFTTALRATQATSFTPRHILSFNREPNPLTGNTMTYTIPAKKLMSDQLLHYVPKVRVLACYPRFYDPQLGDWFRVWEDIYAQTSHAPDTDAQQPRVSAYLQAAVLHYSQAPCRAEMHPPSSCRRLHRSHHFSLSTQERSC